MTDECLKAIRKARRIYQKEYLENNPEQKAKASERSRAWRERNKEKVKEYNRQYWLRKKSERSVKS